MSSSCSPREGRAAIVFSASLTRFLSNDASRLPATNIGVRRVRPSNQAVKDALKKRIPLPVAAPADGKDINHDDTSAPGISHMELLDPTKVSFRTTGEDGVERRMTKREKKALKFELKRKRAEMYKELKKQQALSTSTMDPKQNVDEMRTATEPSQQLEQVSGVVEAEQQLAASASSIDASEEGKYHTLSISETAIVEELAELRGASNRIPPFVLSAPMASEAIRRGILSTSSTDTGEDANASKCEIENNGVTSIDNSLSAMWARAIQESMKIAEAVRSGEDIRPMAYKIVPEVWQRLRPQGLKGPMKLEDEQVVEKEEARTSNGHKSSDVDDSLVSICKEEKQRWSFITTRPVIPRFDDDMSIIYGLLYRQTNLHISCGAKFGCDLLLYDGSREERHAFAGLRVCSSACSDGSSLYAKEQVTDSDGSVITLPLPTAYDVSGYVRCLNTAGKLALLATVVRSECNGEVVARVAIIDLALEKILSAPTHQKKRSGKKRQIRKDGGEHLEKKRG